MAARRGKTQARRNSSSQGTPGWVWLVAGVAIRSGVTLNAPEVLVAAASGGSGVLVEAGATLDTLPFA
ncbi:hypothetical protein ABGA94_12185, partial [Stenotrophomonas sp. 3diitr2024]